MQAPRQPAPPGGSPPDRPPAHATRLRLLGGFADAVLEKGYAATTIADVVRHARVSRRTFYEEFADREDCFLAAYAHLSQEVLRALEGTVDRKLPWAEQLPATLRTYLSLLEERPALTRAFLLEVHVAGEAGLRLRAQVHRAYADFLRRQVQAARRREPSLRPLSAPMATALVGGINELVLVALDEGRGSLAPLLGTAVELVQAVLGAPAHAPGGR
jgi:AcrR family transcriptional regulator